MKFLENRKEKKEKSILGTLKNIMNESEEEKELIKINPEKIEKLWKNFDLIEDICSLLIKFWEEEKITEKLFFINDNGD
jgi:hypothetical protein